LTLEKKSKNTQKKARIPTPKYSPLRVFEPNAFSKNDQRAAIQRRVIIHQKNTSLIYRPFHMGHSRKLIVRGLYSLNERASFHPLENDSEKEKFPIFSEKLLADISHSITITTGISLGICQKYGFLVNSNI
jgi:hypothetical protein